MKLPKLGKAKDGVYPRCVYCDIELYAPSVMAYSLGEVGCGRCNKGLPEDYVVAEAWIDGDDAWT